MVSHRTGKTSDRPAKRRRKRSIFWSAGDDAVTIPGAAAVIASDGTGGLGSGRRAKASSAERSCAFSVSSRVNQCRLRAIS
jgi:hypothetical protein